MMTKTGSTHNEMQTANFVYFFDTKEKMRTKQKTFSNILYIIIYTLTRLLY